MIRTIMYFTVMATIVACQTNESAPNQEYPTTLEGQKTLLAQKKKEFNDLKDIMERLERDIQNADNSEVKRKRVRTTIIETKDIERFVEIQGNVVAEDIINASSEIGGRLIYLLPKEGDYILRGSKIATVDTESIRNQIAEVETSFELANEVYTRQKRLWDQNIGSEIQYLQAKNNKERLEKSLQSIRFNLGKGDIYAPVSGVVERIVVHAGEMAAPGAPIIQILNVDDLKVAIDIPERFINSVKKGSRIKVEIPTVGYEQSVLVTNIGRMIDPANRTFRAEAKISSNGGELKPNLLAIAHISDVKIDKAIAIDSELIQQEIDGSAFVYISETDDDGSAIAVKRYVETGESIDNQLVITKGLEQGMKLITQGARIINDGQAIVIENIENNG